MGKSRVWNRSKKKTELEKILKNFIFINHDCFPPLIFHSSPPFIFYLLFEMMMSLPMYFTRRTCHKVVPATGFEVNNCGEDFHLNSSSKSFVFTLKWFPNCVLYSTCFFSLLFFFISSFFLKNSISTPHKPDNNLLLFIMSWFHVKSRNFVYGNYSSF